MTPAVDVPKIIVVTGPTASGKSDLAEWVAKSCHGEIINADSMQIYRYMDIGTAKPSPLEMASLPHHLFDIADPDESFTAAVYAVIARDKIIEIVNNGRVPVVVGGTGLYIRSLLSGLVETPGADDLQRESYRRLAGKFGNEALHALLERVDPVSAQKIHPNNQVRVIRALEVFSQTGTSLTELQQSHGFALKWCNPLKIGIRVERKLLYERINARVERMIANGFVAEVEKLLSLGYTPDLKSLSSIGYREVCGFLAGNSAFPETVELIKRNTRRYAKRQMTWFNSDPEVNWFEFPLTVDSVSELVTEFLYKEKDF